MKTRQGMGLVALVAMSLAGSACTTVTRFGATPAAHVPTVGDVPALAAQAHAASARDAQRERDLGRCRFEQPGRADRMLWSGSDPRIAACLARLAARSGDPGG
jgi:hypothetical protein